MSWLEERRGSIGPEALVINPPEPLPSHCGSLSLTDAPRSMEKDTEPCENCGSPVLILSVRGVKDIPERPRLMELLEAGAGKPSRWVTHSPTRCRTARRHG